MRTLKLKGVQVPSQYIVVLVLVVFSISAWLMYNEGLEQAKNKLSAIAKSQKSLIEAVSRFDSVYSQDDDAGGAIAATISQVVDAHTRYSGEFGDSGELVMASLEDDSLVFIRQRLGSNKAIPFDSTYAEPMRRALKGESGIILAKDYRGELVLAAYEPVMVHTKPYGIVAKIDHAEVRAPYIEWFSISTTLLLGFFILGHLLLSRYSTSENVGVNSEDKVRNSYVAIHSGWRDQKVFLVILLGSFVTSILTYVDHQREKNASKAEFVLIADTVKTAIQRQLTRNLSVISPTVGYFQGSSFVSRDEFSEYSNHLQLDQLSLHALEWVPRVFQAQRNEIESLMHQAGLTEFQITEYRDGERIVSQTKPSYFPVLYAEPEYLNDAVLGLDLGSDKDINDALAQARDSGKLMASGMMRKQENSNQGFSFMVISPVYKGAINTLSQRRDSLLGFVAVVIDIDKAMTKALQDSGAANLVEIRLYDVVERNRTEIYSSQSSIVEDPFEYLKDIAVAGRQWQIEVVPKQRYLESYYSLWVESLVFVGGMLSTFFIALQFRNSATRHKEIEREVDQQTLELSHTNKLLGATTRIQDRFIIEDDPHKSFDNLLEDLLLLTESEYGFIGEVLHDENNAPYLKTYALTNISWNEETRSLYEKNRLKGLEFRSLDNLIGRVISTGQIVLANSPSTDSRSGGLPEGHPDINRFLGLPLHSGNSMVGMVGIANRGQGYDSTLIEYLQPFLAASGNLISAYRAERARRQADKQLCEANTLLAALTEIQTRFILNEDARSTFNELLTSLLTLTQSEFGLIAEMLYDEEKKPYLQTHAISNIAWNTEMRELYDNNIEQGLAFRNLDNLFGHVVSERKAVIANDPINDPRSGGLPQGHPDLKAFLGLPIFSGDKFIGIVGIANRNQGYDEEMVEFLQPFITACANLIGTQHAEKARQRAELERHQAEAANEAKSAFLANMSHEIRTPMNGVVGMIDLLRETELTIDQQHMAGTIRESVFSLLDIINDILDISKIEAGQMEIEGIPVSINEIAERCADALWLPASQKGVELFLDLDPAIPVKILGDPVRLRQIIFNLVGNAVKFSKGLSRPGKVRLGTSLEINRLGDEQLKIEVQDNGIGMSEEQVGNLFQPFTQADSSTTRKYGGSGLGLSITKSLIEKMSGEIYVRSEPDQGSRFTVTLPIRTCDKSLNLHNLNDVSGMRVLLITVDSDLCMVISRLLHHEGSALDIAVSLDDAMNFIRQKMHDRESGYDAHILGPDIDINHLLRQLEKSKIGVDVDIMRFLPLTQDPFARKGMILPNQVAVGAHPLKPSDLVIGLSVVTGRESPSSIGCETKPSENNKSHKVVPGIAEAERDGHLILVAEDHATNREVIRRQLHQLGFACIITNDGQEALNEWRQHEFALLLTDCHMPHLDGFELTTEIRNEERLTPSSARMPIVAITANALSGEADHCLAAGMDDFLAKPVEIYDLKRTIGRWISTNIAQVQEYKEEASMTDKEAVIDLVRLSEILGSDDSELLNSMLSFYWQTVQEDFASIEQAYQAKKQHELRDLVHAAKGAANSSGAVQLGERLLQLQLKIDEGDWAEIYTALQHVQEGVMGVKEALFQKGIIPGDEVN